MDCFANAPCGSVPFRSVHRAAIESAQQRAFRTMMAAMDDTETLPLLLLAGTLCDGRVFAPVLDRLARPGKVMRLEGAESSPEMATRILARAPRRFALCGFSLGAIVALEMIAQAPERVGRLALIGGSARPMPAETIAARRAAARRAVREGCAGYIATAWEASVPAWRDGDTQLRRELEAMASATDPETFRQQVEIAARRTDSRPRLAAIAVPTLVLCGTEDRICPPELSIEIAAGIGGARLELIEQAGHYVTLDQPDRVARTLADWLAPPAGAAPPTISKEFT